jgi:hypothetical protein
MARIRSPNYPAISLAEAIKRVDQVHKREHQHPASREVIIKGMGYAAAHGASLGAISAAIKYGLLEHVGKGKDYRVSDRAVAILHPHNATEKAEAMHAAAYAPALFKELLEHFHSGLPSDDNLRAYLIRKGFSQRALPGVIQSFRETIDLLSPSGALRPASVIREGIGNSAGIGAATGVGTAAGSAISASVGAPAGKGTAVKVLFNGDRIEVSAVLSDTESVDTLIRALEANKPLLPQRAKDETAN